MDGSAKHQDLSYLMYDLRKRSSKVFTTEEILKEREKNQKALTAVNRRSGSGTVADICNAVAATAEIIVETVVKLTKISCSRASSR